MMGNSLNNPDATKRCSLCLKKKPVNEFYPDPHHSSGCRSRCIECEKAVKKEKTNVVQRYEGGAVVPYTITKSCPCKGCENEKPCGILGLTCKSYRIWQKGRGDGFKKYPKIPDEYLDGTIPGPGVI